MDPFLIPFIKELCQRWSLLLLPKIHAVITSFNKLQSSKADGPDNIPSKVLRDDGPFLASAITPSIFKLEEIVTRLEICDHCANP